METETGNAQMLLGCLLLVVQDSAALEVPISQPTPAVVWCKVSAKDPFSLMRMYAKLAPHSPAPTPARVDARDCGISFEKVADMEASDLTES